MTKLLPLRESTLIFISYSHKDEAMKDLLISQLASLKRSGRAAVWHFRKILPGMEWADRIDMEINRAKIILLLISPDFLASDYCMGIEAKRALARHAEKTAIVVPVILRTTSGWADKFSQLNALPTNVRPIAKWSPRDDGYADVANGIRRLLDNMDAESPPVDNSAESLATKYKSSTDYAGRTEILSDILTQYISHWKSNRREDARDLIDSFDAKVPCDSKQCYKPGHNDINVYGAVVRLLKQGVPRPPHVAGLSDIRVQNVFDNPAYAVMLLAMKQMEVSRRDELSSGAENAHAAALATLSTLHEKSVIRDCALYAYLKGQCHRKMNNYLNAIACFDNGIKTVDRWNTYPRNCPCQSLCDKALLLIELHRGRATTYRRLKEASEAEKDFKFAIQTFDDIWNRRSQSDSSDEDLARLGADINFSYGYHLSSSIFLRSLSVFRSWGVTRRKGCVMSRGGWSNRVILRVGGRGVFTAGYPQVVSRKFTEGIR